LLAARNLRPEDIDTGASIGLFFGLLAALLSLTGAVLRLLGARRPVVTEYPPPPGEPLGGPV